jgi:hypothetical protein
MAIDQTSPRSRRALLLAATGGALAAAAASVARLNPVRAADGDAVTVGGSFDGTQTTQISNTSNDSTTFVAESDSGTALEGTSSNGTGVSAKTSSNSGYALATSGGRIKFGDISGVAEIKENDTQVKVKHVKVDDNTFVLLTPHADIGGSNALWYEKDNDNNEITIKIKESRSDKTHVAYLIIDK